MMVRSHLIMDWSLFYLHHFSLDHLRLLPYSDSNALPESLGQSLGFAHLQTENLTGGHGSEGRVGTQSLAGQIILIL